MPMRESVLPHRRSRRTWATLLLGLGSLGLALTSFSPSAQAVSDKKIHKTIKTVMTALRYKKNDLAAKKIAWRPMTQAIMQGDWSKASSAQQDELVAGVEQLVRRISFPKGQEMFKHLDNISYGKSTQQGDKVLCRATIVVHGKAVKREIVMDFVLVDEGGTWKIADTIVAGESTAEGIHEDQIEDLMDDGGIDAVLKAIRTKLASL